MATIRELAEEHWQGRGELVHTHHPVQPIHETHDDGTRTTAAEEIEDGLLTLKSIASVNALDTGDGLVMLDTGGAFDRRTVYDTVRGWRPAARLAAAIYSHHHIDHVLGTALFDAEAADNGWARPVVYAHEDVPAHFRRYEKTGGWNTAINRRQFAIDVPQFSWPDEYRDPDVTYAKQLTFTRGELTFQLRHARGETDDATWTYVPERKVLHPGDLFIWAVPNAGNPQKVQRYLSDWATALREMAALRPEIMLSGHGLPIFGAERIVAALTDTADLLDSVESQTLAIMNQGKNLDTCLHEVEIPAHLRDKPYLQPVYDHPQFLIRNVWRRYGGWYDGEPDNLLPAPRAQQAAEWIALAGGVDAVLTRATALVEQGDPRLACHLVEYAALAAPDDPEVWTVRAAVYRAHSAQHTSSMARNILGHAAQASEQQRRDLAGDY
jgi:alkyl sulfatase BDS1-like metallo-beta-lactamase superfamily hydrolase